MTPGPARGSHLGESRTGPTGTVVGGWSRTTSERC